MYPRLNIKNCVQEVTDEAIINTTILNSIRKDLCTNLLLNFLILALSVGLYGDNIITLNFV